MTALAQSIANPNADDASSSSSDAATEHPVFDVVSLRGHVVWYAAALKERLGIQSVPEAAERILALATTDGELIPVIEDLRARSFRKDDRLRAMDVELRVRRYRTTPAVQILGIYEWRDDAKFAVDYWCDICSIVMFEAGPCSCCQDDNRLRRRPIDEATGKTRLSAP